MKRFFTLTVLLVAVIALLAVPVMAQQQREAPATPTKAQQQYLFGPGWQLNRDNPGYPLPPSVIVEKDVRVKMRDGTELSCNVYRPNKPGRKFPVLLSFTTYHKDLSGWAEGRAVRPDQVSREASFEALDPGFWVPHDYVVILFDQRGTGLSSGERLGTREGEDFYDGIEWAAAQPWSDGNVGMSGVSALGICQWYAAAAQPPHLKAIVPWEAYIGDTGTIPYIGPRYWGITEFLFYRGNNLYQAPLNPTLGQSIPKVRPPAKVVLGNITVPALICATWSDHELHTQGTLWGYEHISSKYKWLYTHGGQKWKEYSGEEGRTFQKMFFDCFLKGIDNARMLQTPRVRLEVRETIDQKSVRYENEWPIARTEYKKLYLDAATGTLSFNKVGKEGKVTYNSADGAAVFDIKFDQDTELTGYMAMKLWLSPEEANDMDLVVKLRKLDAKGNVVYFDSWHAPETYEVGSGWFRLSWRKLDEKKSRPFQPIPSYEKSPEVKPGEIVPVEFSIYPSSTLFRRGETLRVFVAGSNQYAVVSQRYAYEFLNWGKHSIYTGGKYDSYLLVPVLPPLSVKP
jgi:uncharacterized protein